MTESRTTRLINKIYEVLIKNHQTENKMLRWDELLINVWGIDFCWPSFIDKLKEKVKDVLPNVVDIAYKNKLIVVTERKENPEGLWGNEIVGIKIAKTEADKQYVKLEAKWKKRRLIRQQKRYGVYLDVSTETGLLSHDESRQLRLFEGQFELPESIE